MVQHAGHGGGGGVGEAGWDVGGWRVMRAGTGERGGGVRSGGAGGDQVGFGVVQEGGEGGVCGGEGTVVLQVEDFLVEAAGVAVELCWGSVVSMFGALGTFVRAWG